MAPVGDLGRPGILSTIHEPLRRKFRPSLALDYPGGGIFEPILFRYTSRYFYLTIIFLLTPIVAGDCECGYASTINSTRYVFTDLIETDFLHLHDVAPDTDWVRQGYNVTAKASRGTYGTAFDVSHIISNPLANVDLWSGPGVTSGSPGLQLWVGGGVPMDGFVPTSELDSARTDLIWGSFRASIKLTNISGTCGAFFWYFDDSQEVDMEFLSEQFVKENKTFPVNLVMQTPLSAKQGFQDAGKNFQIAHLPFDPTEGFHEYRIDMVPGYVIYYADGSIIGNMTISKEPPSPGHLILTHWSNGNTGWSFGPPVTDAMMTVSYVKAYFNSSLADRQTLFERQCKEPGVKVSICEIPDQKLAPNAIASDGNLKAETYFFSRQQNMTNGQIVYGNAAPAKELWVLPLHLLLNLMCVLIFQLIIQ